jgi:hypothetical protein
MEVAMTHTVFRHTLNVFATFAFVSAFASDPVLAQTQSLRFQRNL